MAQINCENLALGYDGKAIVSDLSFYVEKGDYLCIIGENGSGKSTLIKALLKLHPQISGKIVLGDGLEDNEIGYLPQQTETQRDFPASVWEIVLSGCLNKVGFRPFYTKAEKALAVKNMEKLNISHLSKKCYRELSGCQQQRVLLARALCATQKILLLDEPVSALDPVATADMYNLIKSLNDDGVTIIMISHDIDASVKYATKILKLGSDVWFGTKSDYISQFSAPLQGGSEK